MSENNCLIVVCSLRWIEMDSGKPCGDKGLCAVCVRSQLQRTFITERAGPVSVFSFHAPIYPALVSKRPAPSPVREKALLGVEESSYLPSLWASRRERPGRKKQGRIVFAINSSRESHGSKIDDTLPESNKRSPVHEGPLMGLDRVVILLINSSDMSAAGTTHWHRLALQEAHCGRELCNYNGTRRKSKKYSHLSLLTMKEVHQAI